MVEPVQLSLFVKPTIVQDFFELRKWCWEQWGASMELDYYHMFHSDPPGWSWHSDNSQRRIYLEGDEQLAVFTLRWS
jgi:hypothetical protein